MILKLKRILEKVPFGKTRLASYAAALYLIKEDWQEMSEGQILTESNDKIVDYIRMYRLENYGKMLEDAPTMNAGDGNVAGMGVNGPDDVKVKKKTKKSYKMQNRVDAAKINGKFQSMFR